VLDCIRIASHAPIGGNREATRWLVLTDSAVKLAVGELYAEVGRPYIGAGRRGVEAGSRRERVLASGDFLIDHLAEVPVVVMTTRIALAERSRNVSRPAEYPAWGNRWLTVPPMTSCPDAIQASSCWMC
jgi:nitroreductase